MGEMGMMSPDDEEHGMHGGYMKDHHEWPLLHYSCWFSSSSSLKTPSTKIPSLLFLPKRQIDFERGCLIIIIRWITLSYLLQRTTTVNTKPKDTRLHQKSSLHLRLLSFDYGIVIVIIISRQAIL
jgi:hypothetical protein